MSFSKISSHFKSHNKAIQYFIIVYKKRKEEEDIIFELFFCKKNTLVGASGMLWAGESVSGSVRDVCLSHQSD